jgi:hypothetical protein
MFASWWNTGPTLSGDATELPRVASSLSDDGNEDEVSTIPNSPLNIAPDRCSPLDQLTDLPLIHESSPDQQTALPPDSAKPLPNVSLKSASHTLRSVPYKPKRAEGTKTKDSRYYAECVHSYISLSNYSANTY